MSKFQYISHTFGMSALGSAIALAFTGHLVPAFLMMCTGISVLFVAGVANTAGGK